MMTLAETVNSDVTPSFFFFTKKEKKKKPWPDLEACLRTVLLSALVAGLRGQRTVQLGGGSALIGSSHLFGTV